MLGSSMSFAIRESTSSFYRTAFTFCGNSSSAEPSIQSAYVDLPAYLADDNAGVGGVEEGEELREELIAPDEGAKLAFEAVLRGEHSEEGDGTGLAW